MKNKKSRGLVLSGWLLLILGIILMFNSLSYIILYGPMFLASFIISIVQLTNKKVASGVTLLLLTLIVPPILWGSLAAYKIGDAVTDYQLEESKKQLNKLNDIKFEEIEIYTSGNYMYCKGKVRNSGTESYDFIKVKVEWLDTNDKVLDTEYTFAVGGEKLSPDEAKSFSIMTEADSRMKRARYYVIE